MSEGSALVHVDALRRFLEHIVLAVIGRLSHLRDDPRAAILAETWKIVSDTNHPEHELWHLAARMGVPLWELENADHDALMQLASMNSRTVRAILDLVSLKELRSVATLTATVEHELDAAKPAGKSWASMRERLQRDVLPRIGTPPWKTGWDAARALRAALNAPATARRPPK